MNQHHIKLVRDVLTRTVNGEHVDPQEYGLALLACDEALADQPAATETQTGVCPNCGYGPVIALPAHLVELWLTRRTRFRRRPGAGRPGG